jgi:hypothetical protein
MRHVGGVQRRRIGSVLVAIVLGVVLSLVASQPASAAGLTRALEASRLCGDGTTGWIGSS